MFQEIKPYRTGRTRFKILFIMLLVVLSMAGANVLLPDPESPGAVADHGEAPVVIPLEASVAADLPGYALEVFDLSLPEGFSAGELVEFQVPVNEEKKPQGASVQEYLSVAVYDEDSKVWGPIPFIAGEETKTLTVFADSPVRFGVVYFPLERSAVKHRLPEFDGLGGLLCSDAQMIPWTNSWEILISHYGMPEGSEAMLSGIPDKETVTRIELLLAEVDAALERARQVKGSLEKEQYFASATKLDAALLALKKELNKEYTITVDLDYYDRVNDLDATKASLRNKQGDITQSISFDANGKAVFAITLFEFLKAGGPTEVAVFVPAYPGYKEFKATLSYRLSSTKIQLTAPYLTPSQKQ